jgi:hypothetical protein
MLQKWLFSKKKKFFIYIQYRCTIVKYRVKQDYALSTLRPEKYLSSY